MVSRLLGAQSRSVTFAAFLLGAASLVSRLAGIVRDRLLSGAFGAGPELDAYYAAFRAPDLVYNLFVLGAVTAGFIPVLARHAHPDAAEDTEKNGTAWRLSSSLLTVLGAGLAALSLAGIVAAPLFVPAMTPGFRGEQLELTVALSRIMFISPFFLGLSGVLGGILQTYRRFVVYAFAPVLYNVGIIFGATALAPRFGIAGVAVGVACGALLHFAVQFAACRGLGFRFRPRWDLRDADLREIGRLMVPRTAALAVSQVNLLLLTVAATTLGAGGLAVFTLANNLQSFPIGILGVSFAVAAFPLISELAAKGDSAKFVESFTRTVKTVMFMIVPATVLFLLLRAQIVRVILGTGSFDWGDTVDTADTLAFFSLSMFAQALLPLAARAFFALKDTKTPLVIAAASVVIERALAWEFLRRGLGTPGLALAFSIGCIVNVALLWVFLRMRTGGLDEGRTFRAIALMSAAAMPMAVCVQLSKIAVASAVDMRSFVGIFAQGSVSALVGVAVYLAVALAMGSEEARGALQMLRRRLATVPPATIRQEGDTLNTET